MGEGVLAPGPGRVVGCLHRLQRFLAGREVDWKGRDWALKVKEWVWGGPDMSRCTMMRRKIFSRGS